MLILTAVDYIIAGGMAFLIGIFMTPIMIRCARRFKILDYPTAPRKIHKKPMPLLGGLGIFFVFFITLAFFYFGDSLFHQGTVLPKHLLGILIGGGIVVIGGVLDDLYNLKPRQQIVFPILAILSIIISGIGIDTMTNPVTGEFMRLDTIKTIFFWYHGLPYKLTLIADLFTVVWLLGMMYTTKLLDGIDGLVSGITVIGGLFIFITSLIGETVQGDVALLAIILVGAFLAFLLFNFNPAKIFLGESGSIYAGFMLGVLSIISGSKVAVTLILLGIPILDVLWTIIRRLMEGKNPFKTADKKHLHHRLLAAGFSVRQTVFFLYFLSIGFGLAAVLLQQANFAILLVGLGVLVVFLLLLAYLYKVIREKGKSALDGSE